MYKERGFYEQRRMVIKPNSLFFIYTWYKKKQKCNNDFHKPPVQSQFFLFIPHLEQVFLTSPIAQTKILTNDI